MKLKLMKLKLKLMKLKLMKLKLKLMKLKYRLIQNDFTAKTGKLQQCNPDYKAEINIMQISTPTQNNF